MKFVVLVATITLSSVAWGQGDNLGDRALADDAVVNETEVDTATEEEVDTKRHAVAGQAALLRGLDTITGSARNVAVAVGKSTKFGRLTIQLHACRYWPENPSTHSFAFVEVIEDEDASPIFKAWLIAASPAISAMEHPRYDIWLIRCNADTESPSNF